MKAVKETISDPALLNTVEEYLGNLFRIEPNQIHTETKRTESELASILLKQQNLMKAIEVGTDGNAVEFLTNRLSELLQNEQGLLEKLHQMQSELSDAHNHLSDWSDAIARFVLNFETEFEKAPIKDQKSLIKKCVSRIVVDREEGSAKVYVRRIPAITPELQRLLEPAADHPAIAGTPKNKELTPHGVSSGSARNPDRKRPEENSGQVGASPERRIRSKQDMSSVAMTSGNEKTSVKEVFCFQCPESR